MLVRSTSDPQVIAGASTSTALVIAETTVSYGEVVDRVESRRAELGQTRRLVMVSSALALEPIVTYLAARASGHPVMFYEAGDPGTTAHRHARALIKRFDPDVVAMGEAEEWRLDIRREGTRHRLHPNLAMLSSTSGSTGSPKLVRLSHENLRSNAIAIADYLNLTPDDRAAATLPLHYCYGLSVLNSHLSAGASVMVTDHSVVEEDFWNEFERAGATSFAGVPYTFDLLDASGFAEREVPSLRYVTQAGGRLAPERVRAYASLGRERGFDFFVMYGQTEATARMAYLPPDLAESASETIGVPIPGGDFRIDSPADDGTGELVYRGANVMMGYAEGIDDFAAGATINELRTGDLARMRDDGLYKIVGRASRFVKVFGLRLDLDRVEALLLESGMDVRAVGADERLVLFARTERQVAATRSAAVETLGLPEHAIRVYAVAEFPRTSSGKPDHAALARFAADQDREEASVVVASPEAVCALYRRLLARPDAGFDDSFTTLGGDSLSFVEVALRLEELLGGPLPREWPSMSIRELAGQPQPVGRPAARRRLPRVETPALLRAIAIVLIVATHADLIFVQGGAHLLLAVTGYNLARFQLAAPGRSRVRGLLRSAVQVAVPAVLWIGAVGLATGKYGLATSFLVNSLIPDAHWDAQWQFWFIEIIVWTLVGLALTLGVPFVSRLEGRFPYAFALVLLALAVTARVAVSGGIESTSMSRYTALGAVWLIALGWVIARSARLSRRIIATAIVLVTIPGFFGEPVREAVLVAGLVALIWLPALALPRVLVPVVGALAGASLFIYLTHWGVYPPFEQFAPVVGTLLSFAAGVAVWKAYTAVTSRSAAIIRSRLSARRVGDDSAGSNNAHSVSRLQGRDLVRGGG